MTPVKFEALSWSLSGKQDKELENRCWPFPAHFKWERTWNAVCCLGQPPKLTSIIRMLCAPSFHRIPHYSRTLKRAWLTWTGEIWSPRVTDNFRILIPDIVWHRQYLISWVRLRNEQAWCKKKKNLYWPHIKSQRPLPRRGRESVLSVARGASGECWLQGSVCVKKHFLLYPESQQLVVGHLRSSHWGFKRW